MKISGAEDRPQSRVVTGYVEKGHVVTDSYVGTVGSTCESGEVTA